MYVIYMAFRILEFTVYSQTRKLIIPQLRKKQFFRLLIKTSFPEGMFTYTLQKESRNSNEISMPAIAILNYNFLQRKHEKKIIEDETLISVNCPSHECTRMENRTNLIYYHITASHTFLKSDEDFHYIKIPCIRNVQ